MRLILGRGNVNPIGRKKLRLCVHFIKRSEIMGKTKFTKAVNEHVFSACLVPGELCVLVRCSHQGGYKRFESCDFTRSLLSNSKKEIGNFNNKIGENRNFHMVGIDIMYPLLLIYILPYIWQMTKC